MPLDSESIEVMEKVKRGTPARFVMLTKGMKVLSIIAFRRGTVDSVKKKAKEAGAGDISFGVVDGQGANISFKLARADGFEKPPVRDILVKSFLAESKLDFKPVIEIVDVLPDVPMDDADPPQTPPPPPPQRRGAVYRSRNEWDAILAGIEQATDVETKDQRFSQAVDSLRGERTQIENDPFMSGDPNAKIEQNDVHRDVGQRLRALANRPLPQNSNLPPSNPPQRLPPQVPPRHLQPSVQGGPLDREPPQPPPRQIPPQNPPQRLQPNVPNNPQNVPPPQKVRPPFLHADGRVGAPQSGRLSQAEEDRKTMIADAERRRKAFTPVPFPYTKQQLRNILTECETDGESDFGQVASGMLLHSNDTYEILVKRLEDARTNALKYVKNHRDPKIGKLPSRVVRRREYCEQFLPQIEIILDQFRANEGSAKEMIQTYGTLLERQQEIPFGVADEINAFIHKTALSVETKAELTRIAEAIQAADQVRGYELLAQTQNPSELEKADLLLRHGCFKFSEGGTSDVRLLRNPDRSIAFAFKRLDGEAPGALVFLQLPQGACATREDLCSTMADEIRAQTGLDLGFPKSQSVHLAGKTGALIEGIRGKTVDPQEYAQLIGETPINQEAVDEKARDLNEIPERITAKSLQKVVLFSTLTCQWDCKWGNLMVEGEDNARPLDGGAAFPTQDVVNTFANRRTPLALLALTQYPLTNVVKKKGQNLHAHRIKSTRE